MNDCRINAPSECDEVGIEGTDNDPSMGGLLLM